MAAALSAAAAACPSKIPLPSTPGHRCKTPSFVSIPLLAGPSARRNSVQAWTETAIPVIVLLIVAFALSRSITISSRRRGLADTARQAGEIGFIVLGMALVVIVGGIDLSVGSMFALCDFCALYCLNVLNGRWPRSSLRRWSAARLLGAVNGVLIGYLRLRAFITTLITLIIYRSAYDLLMLR